MTATISARRLSLRPGELSQACRLLALQPPPGFESDAEPLRTPGVLVDGSLHPAIAATLAAACAPDVGVVVRTDVGQVCAAVGVRGDVGGSLIRAGQSDVEVSTWRATRLGPELTRTVPTLGDGARPTLHLPLQDVATSPEVLDVLVGTLQATVVAPPAVVGVVVWLATSAGWLTLEPAESVGGVRWANVRPVEPTDLPACVAPMLAAALA